STPSGALAFTIPGAGPSTYELAGASSSSGLFPFPVPSQALPFLFPLIAVALLWASYLVVRWTRRQSGDADRDELERNDWESDDRDSNADQYIPRRPHISSRGRRPQRRRTTEPTIPPRTSATTICS